MPSTPPRTVHCVSSPCIVQIPVGDGQYAGAPGAPPSITIGGGLLPYTGFEGFVLVAVALLILFCGAVTRRVA